MLAAQEVSTSPGTSLGVLCLHASFFFLFRFLSCLFLCFRTLTPADRTFKLQRLERETAIDDSVDTFLEESVRTGQEPNGCSQWEGCGGRATSGHVWSPLLSPRLPSNRLSDRSGCKVMPRLQRRSCT